MPSENGNGGMHKRVGWMVAADPSILEFMEAARDAQRNPAILRPATISDNIGYSAKHIGNRFREELVERGLVEKVDRGKYRLTEKGVKVVQGDILPEELED